MNQIPTILKGDDATGVSFSIAEGRNYSGCILVVAYQGVTRTYSDLVSGESVAFDFTHDETASFRLGCYPVLARLIGADGSVETISNAEWRVKVTDVLAEVRPGDGFIVRRSFVPATDVGEIGSRFTLADVAAKVNELVRVLAQSSAVPALAAALACLSAFGAEVQTARLDGLYNDASVVTNVTFDGLVAGDYETVSNKAMNAAAAYKDASELISCSWERQGTTVKLLQRDSIAEWHERGQNTIREIAYDGAWFYRRYHFRLGPPPDWQYTNTTSRAATKLTFGEETFVRCDEVWGGDTNKYPVVYADALAAVSNATNALARTLSDTASTLRDTITSATNAIPRPDWNAAPDDAAAINNRPAVGKIEVSGYRDIISAIDAVARPLGGEVATTARKYVQNGLVLLWDGIENVGWDTNDPSAGVWTNLATPGELDLSIPGGSQWTESGLQTVRAYGRVVSNQYSNPEDTAAFRAYDSGNWTVEIVFDKAADTPRSDGTGPRNCTMLVVGHRANWFGTLDHGENTNSYSTNSTNRVGFNPSNEGAEGSLSCVLVRPKDGEHTLSFGFHTMSCRQSTEVVDGATNSTASLTWDGLSAASASVASVGGVAKTDGIRFNRGYSADRGLDGVYHCVRIYNRALTDDEIARNREVDLIRFRGGWRPKTSGIVNDGEDGVHPFASRDEVASAATSATNHTDAATNALAQTLSGELAIISDNVASNSAATSTLSSSIETATNAFAQSLSDTSSALRDAIASATDSIPRFGVAASDTLAVYEDGTRLAKTVKTLGRDTFNGPPPHDRSQIVAIYGGTNCTALGSNPTEGHANLRTVVLPSVANAPASAFYGKTSLERVEMQSLAAVPASVFQGCSSLKSVYLPAATSFGQSAFSSCSSLMLINLGPTARNSAPAFSASGVGFSSVPYRCIVVVPDGNYAEAVATWNIPQRIMPYSDWAAAREYDAKGATRGAVVDTNQSIFDFNPVNSVTPKILAARKRYAPKNYWLGALPLVIAHMSDLHSSARNLRRYVEFCRKYREYIDVMLNTGDSVANGWSDDFDYYGKVPGADKIFNLVGNHDSNTADGGWRAKTAAQCRERYIDPFVTNWGVTIPDGVCYYYKDFPRPGTIVTNNTTVATTNTVRLVALDVMHFDADQLAWFGSLLDDARTNGFHVAVATHFVIDCEILNSEFNPSNGGDVTRGHAPGGNILGYLGNSVYTYFDAFAAVKAFMDGGGKFACWLVGHQHFAYVGRIADTVTYGRQLVVAADTARANGLNAGFAVRSVDGLAGTQTEDGFSIVSIDPEMRKILVQKIGRVADFNGCRADSVCLSYDTENESLGGMWGVVEDRAMRAKVSRDELDAALQDIDLTGYATTGDLAALASEVAPAVAAYPRVYSFMTGATNANFVVTNYQLTAEADAGRTHFDPADPDLDFSTVPSSLRLEDASSGTNRVVVDVRDWTVWYYACKIGKAVNTAFTNAVETCRAWCGFTATGLENPVPDTLIVDVPNIWLMAGKTFEKHVAGTNSMWVIRSKDTVVPISDNAQSAGGFLELTDAFGEPYIRFNKTESYFLDPVADGIVHDAATGAWQITYPTQTKPRGGANAVLQGSTTYPGKAVLKDEDDPDCPATITWTGSAGSWVMNAVPKMIDGETPRQMFFGAVVEVQGQDFIEYLRPMSVPHLLVDGVKIAPVVPASHPAGTTVTWKVVE